ncbi:MULTISPECIES: SAM-dependent methyltransferase [Streptomyces]|jgi:methyltransferase (TIGR00027 family)|uniref:S-adenosyl-L-methionine-dependent methyltransferase n=2 Tax=Streptomyces TaxID=1883 RepID=A0ABT9L9Y7_STRGD|nr:MULTISPECIES: SAM-dependent methyltransferase [Streptomyces]MDP9680517.1 methyltransferase (TIGR00027 family) [Streptomyces griseoviridis]GGT08471.1 S-adenosyl-L-methionine-dependent methyltransferase [Streptomyces griseoviridis]GGU49894.1 S-adenosyl-L-methionine-dependent methyltransferase [Streptomyces daghestanicus]GHI28955.1 S-adenosyl-L-methionine-dependent methyltransferase [Streptomyces daghestanicus]
MPDAAEPTSPQGVPLPDGLSKVAVWTASAHAAEQERATPYVRDPWAADFLHAAGFPPGGPPGDGPLQRLLPDWAVVRSRFFDEHLLAAARSGCRQVVLLGAGLDTRAFRLEWPRGVHVFEVEDPALLAFKEHVLDWAPPTCGRRSTVGISPTGAWTRELCAQGFDPVRPTAWLAETLLYHLPPRDAESVVTTMTELSAPGSTFGAECVNAQVSSSSLVTPFLEALSSTGISWQWQLAEPERWWAEHGWEATVADLFTLPYVVQRLAPCLPLLGEAAARTVFLTTGTLRDPR